MKSACMLTKHTIHDELTHSYNTTYMHVKSHTDWGSFFLLTVLTNFCWGKVFFFYKADGTRVNTVDNEHLRRPHNPRDILSIFYLQ